MSRLHRASRRMPNVHAPAAPYDWAHEGVWVDHRVAGDSGTVVREYFQSGECVLIRPAVIVSAYVVTPPPDDRRRAARAALRPHPVAMVPVESNPTGSLPVTGGDIAGLFLIGAVAVAGGLALVRSGRWSR